MNEDLDDVRPLIAGIVRWDAGGAVVDLDDREVRIAADDRELLSAILGECHGRTTVAQLSSRHGEETLPLLRSLLAEGALVDGEHAWRVLHRQSSAGSALGRATTTEEAAALARERYEPAVAGAAEVALDPPPTTTAATAARRRSALPADPPVPATFAGLSAVLAAAYRLHGAPPTPGAGSVPSAGALYPLVVHVLLREPLGAAAPGLWWSDARRGVLRRLGDGPADVAAVFVPEPGCDALLARRQPVVFLSADLRRPSRRYGARGYRYSLIEVGAALQAASLAATELGIPLRAVGGIDDGAAHAALALPDTAIVVLALLIGS